jgi:hypothetical protein
MGMAVMMMELGLLEEVVFPASPIPIDCERHCFGVDCACRQGDCTYACHNRAT